MLIFQHGIAGTADQNAQPGGTLTAFWELVIKTLLDISVHSFQDLFKFLYVFFIFRIGSGCAARS